MKRPSNHIAAVLRAIILIVVIVTQFVVPVAGRPLVCGPECGRAEETHRCDDGGAADHGCSGILAGDDHGDHAPEPGKPGAGEKAGCIPDGCPCCALLMLPDIVPLPDAEPRPATVFSPALLGDPITRFPLPPDHPPC